MNRELHFAGDQPHYLSTCRLSPSPSPRSPFEHMPVSCWTRARALACLVLAATASADAPVADHELVMFDGDQVTEEAVVKVLTGFGYQQQHWKPIIEALDKGGKGGVVGVRGSKAGCERAQKAFEAIGMKTAVRAQPAGAYGESDVQEVTSAKQLEDLINGAESTLLKFYGSSCSACHAMISDYKAAATELKGKVRVAAVNLQMLPEAESISNNLRISALPTIRFVRSGDFMEYAGATRTKDDLVAFASQALDAVGAAGAAKEEPSAKPAPPAESKIGQSKVQQAASGAATAAAAAAA